jgi:hypothetical protein
MATSDVEVKRFERGKHVYELRISSRGPLWYSRYGMSVRTYRDGRDITTWLSVPKWLRAEQDKAREARHDQSTD